MEVRLQKRIAESGIASRRMAEEWILKGKVSVNGIIVKTLGTKTSDADEVKVNGKILAKPVSISVMLYKPANTVTSRRDPHEKNTVMDLLPKHLKKLKPAGRLDKESEGLLILSSDGDFIQKLTHPKYAHQKTYEMLVKGKVDNKILTKLAGGKIKLGDYTLNPMFGEILNTESRGTWLKLVLSEGRNRQIRRVMDFLGHPVLYLKRTAIGKLDLGVLKKGEFKILSPSECSKALSL